ncbi:MAG: hypothetical protein KAI26_02810 [Nanoarchaeota archaeon]|nr:hypothetical protein [Nanoarchaeota archaeon]
MTDNANQIGYIKSRPYYVIDKDSGNIVPVYLPADAVLERAKPGSKAGSSLLDKINEELKQEGLIEKMKGLYKIEKNL